MMKGAAGPNMPPRLVTRTVAEHCLLEGFPATVARLSESVEQQNTLMG